jgi:hypothetical protein
VPSTIVRYLRSDSVVAEEVVPGRILHLAPPSSVQVQHRAGAIDLIEDPDPLLECCGRLTLVTLDDALETSVVGIEIPPPPPFTPHDLREMWDARNRLTSKRRSPTSGEADWSETSLSPSLQVRLERLPAAITSARGLLAHWPEQLIAVRRTLPLEQHGGREDLLATARHAAQTRPITHGRRLLPSRTVRTFGAAERRRCGAVSTIAALLRSQADRYLDSPLALPDAYERRAVLSPLAAVSEAAAVPTGSVDGPPSTWPSRMRTFYSLAAIALAELEIVGAGDDTAPLSELWELYQAWVAEGVLAAVIATLGPPTARTGRSSLLGRWVVAGDAIELHYQPLIPSRPGRTKTILGAPAIATIGDLQPDLILACRTSSGLSRALVIDPKKRPYLDPGTVTVEASKYLWGIDGLPLEGVLLTSPTGGASARRLSGRAWTVAAKPVDAPLTHHEVANWLQLLRR